MPRNDPLGYLNMVPRALTQSLGPTTNGAMQAMRSMGSLAGGIMGAVNPQPQATPQARIQDLAAATEQFAEPRRDSFISTMSVDPWAAATLQGPQIGSIAAAQQRSLSRPSGPDTPADPARANALLQAMGFAENRDLESQKLPLLQQENELREQALQQGNLVSAINAYLGAGMPDKAAALADRLVPPLSRSSEATSPAALQPQTLAQRVQQNEQSQELNEDVRGIREGIRNVMSMPDPASTRFGSPRAASADFLASRLVSMFENAPPHLRGITAYEINQAIRKSPKLREFFEQQLRKIQKGDVPDVNVAGLLDMAP